MTLFLVFVVYFIGIPVSYIVSMKRAMYVISRHESIHYPTSDFEMDQKVGTAVFTGLSWLGLPLLGITILLNKGIKFINRKFKLDE